jgi:hypothetical protein
LRITLPRPPATEPVDRQDIHASIVSNEWCSAHNIPIPSEIVDGEYQLAQEVYRRVLYSETWTEKDQHMQKFFAIVDDKRDFNLKQTSDVTFQCLDRHAKSVRRIAHDSAQIKSSQQAQYKLTSNYRDLEKLNLKLAKQVEDEKKKCKQLQHQLAIAKSEATKKSPGSRGSDTTPTTRAERKTLSQSTPLERSKTRNNTTRKTPTLASPSSSTTTQSPSRYSDVRDGYESPSECEIELSNLALQNISDQSENEKSSPVESVGSLRSEQLEFLQDQHADLQYESEQERLATLFRQEKPKKKLTFDIPAADNYSACLLCFEGSDKRTGHRGPHLTKRRPSSTK